jgi:membrane protein implicated in regulation of membrane protease activity
LPAFNLATLTAFLAWFGGIGYLLTVHSSLYGMAALGLATLGGLVGATLIFFAISKIILRHEDVEFESGDLVGMLGRITSTVFENGTGELVYVQRGTRHTCAARTEDGSAVPKATEVIVTRYEKGIAYVRPWEEMAEATFESDRKNSVE